MTPPRNSLGLRVILLTLLVSVGTASCSHVKPYVKPYYAESCKSHAYVRTVLAEWLTTRYHTDAPARLGIVPFSTQANLAARNNELPGLGNDLAWRLQGLLASRGDVPIVEVLNRQDWPGKKEEFFTGNFGAIAAARDAGYDLVLVGLVEPLKRLDELEATVKIIEPESGITVWYGRAAAHTERDTKNLVLSKLWLANQSANPVHMSRLVDELAQCLVREISKDS